MNVAPSDPVARTSEGEGCVIVDQDNHQQQQHRRRDETSSPPRLTIMATPTSTSNTAWSGSNQAIDRIERIEPTIPSKVVKLTNASKLTKKTGNTKRVQDVTRQPRGNLKDPTDEGIKEASPPKKRSKKPWKKPKGMPKRPLSAYNLFFRSTRETLLGEEVAKEFEITDQSKRKHRKTHGKIGFAEMARLISEKWKSLGESKRRTFVDQAKIEKERYEKELQEWKQKTLAQEEEQALQEEKTRSAEVPPASAEDAAGAAMSSVAAQQHHHRGQRNDITMQQNLQSGASSVSSNNNAAFQQDRQMANLARIRIMGQQHAGSAQQQAQYLAAAHNFPPGFGIPGQSLGPQNPQFPYSPGAFNTAPAIDALGGSLQGIAPGDRQMASAGVRALGGSLRGVQGEASPRRNMVRFMDAMGGSLRGVPGEMMGRRNLAAAMDSMGTSFRGTPSEAMSQESRLQRLQQLYSLHLAEAASLREELGRESTGAPVAPSELFVQQSRQSAVVPSAFDHHLQASNLEFARADLLALERATAARRAESAMMNQANNDRQPSQAEIRAMELEWARRMERRRNGM